MDANRLPEIFETEPSDGYGLEDEDELNRILGEYPRGRDAGGE